MIIGIVLLVIGLVIGYLIARGTVKYTYGGEMVITRTQMEDGLEQKSFFLEVATDLDRLDQKKHVIFKVVPKQASLF